MAADGKFQVHLGIIALSLMITLATGAIVGGVGRQVSASKCAQYNFKPLDLCCKSSPGNLIPFEGLKGCKQHKTRANYKILEKYVLNKANTGIRKYDLQTRRGRMELESGPVCFAECAFRNLSLLNDENEIDFTKAEKYFIDAVDGIVGWTEIITAALQDCETHAGGTENKTISTTNFRKCYVQPAIYMQCIQSHIIQKCPTADTVKTAWCNNRRNEFKVCNYFATAK